MLILKTSIRVVFCKIHFWNCIDILASTKKTSIIFAIKMCFRLHKFEDFEMLSLGFEKNFRIKFRTLHLNFRVKVRMNFRTNL